MPIDCKLEADNLEQKSTWRLFYQIYLSINLIRQYEVY